jgi:hypothetical protein
MRLGNPPGRHHFLHRKIDPIRKKGVATASLLRRISAGIISLIVSLAAVVLPVTAKNTCPADQTGDAVIPGLISHMIGGRMSAQGVGWALKAIGSPKRTDRSDKKTLRRRYTTQPPYHGTEL